MDFHILKELHGASKIAQVSYSIHYHESDDSWTVTIRSLAPSENWQSGTYTFKTAINSAIDYVKGLYD